jgi:hypothetical protein
MHISAALLVAVLSASSPGLAQDSVPPSVHSTIRTPTARFALERAARAAVEKLEHPDCARVLSDFRDGSGRTLREGLEALGETPTSYLARITFHEALDSRSCRNHAVLAFSIVGNRDVYVCSPQFWETYRSNPVHVEAIVIHEMMHTLGLGENPPSATQINEQVLRRCR